MADTLTLLRSSSNVMAKTWQTDGSITAYDKTAMYFSLRVVEVGDIHALSKELTALERDRHTMAIRGTYAGDEIAKQHDGFKPGLVRRRNALFHDKPHHWVLLEVDNYVPTLYDPVHEPEGACREFVAEKMPAEFQDTSFHWQLSNSSGAAKNDGFLKVHIWVWLDSAFDSLTLKAWATANGIEVDTSVLQTVQIHYTSAPVFEGGVTDPVPVRSGFFQGCRDSVPLVVDLQTQRDASVASGHRIGAQQRIANFVSTDPLAIRLNELGMVKSTRPGGALNIECPRSEFHTGDSSETATTYFPKNTNSFPDSMIVCQHAHCRNVRRSVWLVAVGLDPLGDEFKSLDDDGKPAGVTWADDIPEAQHLTTDMSNVLRLLKRYQSRLIVVRGMWYVWQGTHWAPDEGAVYKFAASLSKIIQAEADEWGAKVPESMAETERFQALEKALRSWSGRSEMKTGIDSAVTLARKMLGFDDDRMDANPYLLNVANGTVDLRTGQLRDHSADDFITRLIPFNYDPDAQCPTWESALAQIAQEANGGEKLLCRFLRRWFGYCATGAIYEQKFAIHWGAGANGKSTILDTIARILGDYATTAAPGLLMASRGDRHPTEIADLLGRRMVTAHETGEGGVLREDLIKQITGGDRIKARLMRSNFFEFGPTHKLQLLTNHRPVIRGQDTGIWRRVMLVPYGARFGSEDEVKAGKATAVRDVGIMDRLDAETEGILAWIVAGAVEWHTIGLVPPPVVVAASEEYRTEQDRVLQFVEEVCETGRECADYVTGPGGTGIYPAYVSWCKAGGTMPLSKQKLIAELQRCVQFFAKTEKKGKDVDGSARKFTRIHGISARDALFL